MAAHEPERESRSPPVVQPDAVRVEEGSRPHTPEEPPPADTNPPAGVVAPSSESSTHARLHRNLFVEVDLDSSRGVGVGVGGSPSNSSTTPAPAIDGRASLVVASPLSEDGDGEGDAVEEPDRVRVVVAAPADGDDGSVGAEGVAGVGEGEGAGSGAGSGSSSDTRTVGTGVGTGAGADAGAGAGVTGRGIMVPRPLAHQGSSTLPPAFTAGDAPTWDLDASPDLSGLRADDSVGVSTAEAQEAVPISPEVRARCWVFVSGKSPPAAEA